VIGDFHCDVGGIGLCNSGFAAEMRHASIHELSDMVDESSCSLDFDIHVSKHELDGLILNDWLAKLDALFGIARGKVKRTFADAKCLRCNARTRAVEGGQANLEAITLLAEQIRCGNNALLKDELAGL